MNELYTELTLEKIDNKPSGPENKMFTDYKLLFEDKLTSTDNEPVKISNDGVKRRRLVRKHRRKKVLVKADLGKGKTTLMKRDWAAGIFRRFSLVFFEFLKLVRPQEAIENIIIRQHPILKGTNVKANRLQQMFENFGDQCLIIFDGLDEHSLGQNQDVIDIIRGEMFPYCNIYSGFTLPVIRHRVK